MARSNLKSTKLQNDIFGIIGFLILCIFLLLPLIQSFLPSPFEQNLQNRLLEVGSGRYIFGTDQFGRDLFSRLIYGIRISLVVGILGSVISSLIGISIGLLSGYFGGKIDSILMRLTDMIMGFPTLLLLIALSAVMEPGIKTVIIAISFVSWTGMARIVRSQVLSIKTDEFIYAAKSLGFSEFKILLHHVLPNCIGPILISFTLGISGAIMAEASLSFLGLGIQPPMPSWGIMISEGKAFFRIAPALSILPGCVIAFAVIGFNLLGEALRDLLDK
ncbi:MAG: peptide ABC transporter permease [Candidatus Marinimicrobia bacterium]|nr:peptide ABC transporter permease [Candidatus Neomarinimicrobiota bacterium]